MRQRSHVLHTLLKGFVLRWMVPWMLLFTMYNRFLVGLEKDTRYFIKCYPKNMNMCFCYGWLQYNNSYIIMSRDYYSRNMGKPIPLIPSRLILFTAKWVVCFVYCFHVCGHVINLLIMCLWCVLCVYGPVQTRLFTFIGSTLTKSLIIFMSMTL